MNGANEIIVTDVNMPFWSMWDFWSSWHLHRSRQLLSSTQFSGSSPL